MTDLGDVGAFGDLTHLEVSGDLDGPDGHCHELVGGVGVVAAVVGVVIFLLGFRTTLFGQDKFGGLFALYLGAVVVGVLPFCSEELVAAVGLVVVLGAVVAVNANLAGGFDLSRVTVGPGPSYGSLEAGLLNIFIISCDMPIGLFGAVALDGVADLADGCEPVRALEDAEVLGAVGKKLSEVSTTGENLIFLVALKDSLSASSSSELKAMSGFSNQSDLTGKLDP